MLFSKDYLVVRAWIAQKSEARWGEEQAAKTQCKGANRPVACGKVDENQSTECWIEYGVQRAGSIVEGDDGVRITERGRSRPQTDATKSRPLPAGGARERQSTGV